MIHEERPTMTQQNATTSAATEPGGAGDAGSRGPNQLRRIASSGGGATQHAALLTEHGSTRIADGVVARIAGLATREIPGVHDMGKGLARTLGGLRARMGGPGEDQGGTQGVSVEVGERQAAVDLDVVTYYGQSIVEVTDAVRRNVIERVQSMTGLEVTEVNIMVDDLYVEGDAHASESRVQ
jgi:uncharacterized alkaline shock family protein YloU